MYVTLLVSVFQTNKKATDEDEGNQSLSLLTFNFGCILYVLAGYGACIYIYIYLYIYMFMPLVSLWERHEAKKGNRGCLFQGCSAVALADRCRPSQFDKGSFFFQINNFCN